MTDASRSSKALFDYAKLIREAGIEVDYAFAHTVERPNEFYVEKVIARISGDLTFEMLERASVLMGTKKINVECELGCESDMTHDTHLIFYKPAPPRWSSDTGESYQRGGDV